MAAPGPSPTGRAAGAVGVLALLALVLPGAVILAGLAVLASAVASDLGRVRREPALSRTLPRLLSRGTPAEILVEGLDATLTVAQPTPAGLACTPFRNSPRGSSASAELTAARRGRHLLPPLVVRRTGPLRLGAWTHRVGGEVAVRVYPDLPGAQRLASSPRLRAMALAGQSLRGPLGLGTDFEALRDYRPDDDVRQVNWRATARLQRPMSNTYRVEQSRRVLLAIDCGRGMVAPVAGYLSRLDCAVDAAAAVALAADRVGDRVGVVAFDDEVRALVRPTSGGGHDVIRALADLEPRFADSDPELLVAGLNRGMRTSILVLTDVFDQAAGRSLVIAAQELSRRHDVHVLALTDDQLDAVLARRPRSVEDGMLLAAVADLDAARQEVVAQLRRAGAAVIEAPAASLAAAAVSALATGRRTRVA